MKKLSLRLQHLMQWSLIKKYDYIYDVCCDHAHLAINLASNTNSIVHAIDISKEVISKLAQYLGELKPDNLIVECQGGESVDYQENSLIIIAGVGAHTTIKILDHIQSLDLNEVEIILCCHQNTDILRDYLLKTSFKLLNEDLIVDNQKYYELMHIADHGKMDIDMIGSLMWEQCSPELASRYREHQLQYWRIRRDEISDQYVKAYEDLEK